VLIGHISDTHLGFRQYNLDEREEDFYRTYEELIEKLIEERVDLIVHSGDLFESPRPPTKALLVVQNSVLKLWEKNIAFYAIPGGHDQFKRRGLPPHALFERLGMKVLTHRKPYDIFRKGDSEVFIAGIQHVPKHLRNALLGFLDHLSNKAKSYKKKIILLHQSIKEFFPIDYELSLADLPNNFNYYAMGHIHKRLVKEFGEGLLAYSGSTEIWNRKEYQDYIKEGKGAYVVDISGDEPVIHKIDIDLIRPHVIEEIEAERINYQLNKLMRRIKDFKMKPIIHLTIRGSGINRRLIRSLANRILSPYALTVRLEFESEHLTEGESILETTSRLNIRELMYNELKDPRIAELAYRLFEILQKEDLEEARKLVKEFYEAGFF